jgi:hypothetical protein
MPCLLSVHFDFKVIIFGACILSPFLLLLKLKEQLHLGTTDYPDNLREVFSQKPAPFVQPQQFVQSYEDLRVT